MCEMEFQRLLATINPYTTEEGEVDPVIFSKNEKEKEWSEMREKEGEEVENKSKAKVKSAYRKGPTPNSQPPTKKIKYADSLPGPRRRPCLWCELPKCRHCQCESFTKCSHRHNEPCVNERYGRRLVCNSCERNKLLDGDKRTSYSTPKQHQNNSISIITTSLPIYNQQMHSPSTAVAGLLRAAAGLEEGI